MGEIGLSFNQIQKLHSLIHSAVTENYGIEAMAKILGKKEQVLRNELCGTNDNHKLGMITVVNMILLCDDKSFIQYLCELCGGCFTAYPPPEACQEDYKDLLMLIFDELGRASKSFLDAATGDPKSDIKTESIAVLITAIDTAIRRLNRLKYAVIEAIKRLRGG